MIISVSGMSILRNGEGKRFHESRKDAQPAVPLNRKVIPSGHSLGVPNGYQLLCSGAVLLKAEHQDEWTRQRRSDLPGSAAVFMLACSPASDIECTEQFLTVCLVSNDSGNIIIPVL